MASAPPAPPPGTPPPPPAVGLPGDGVPGVIAQINGTLARVQTMQCTATDPGNNPYAKVLLEDAYERMRQHATEEAPLSPEDSLALRKEIDRLSELVHGKQPSMSAGYSAGERAVLAERAEQQRRRVNNIGLAAGGVLAAPAIAGRILGAPEAAVENLAQIGANLGGARLVGPRRVIMPVQAKPVPALSAPQRPPAPAPGRPASPAAAPPPPAAPPPASTTVARRKPSGAQRREDENNAKIDEHLRKEGRDVKPNPDEGQAGAGRQGDRIVDGKKTEYKTITPEPGQTPGPNTIRNQINNSVRSGGQARDVVIWARGSGLTAEQAAQGLQRGLAISRGRIDSIRVIGDGFDLKVP